MKIFLVIVGYVVSLVTSQTPGCDYYQQVQPGQQFYVASPNYMNSYPKGILCRWTLECPNANCRAECSEMNIPYTANCAMDRLLISTNGDDTLNTAQRYCGTGSLVVTSTGNKLVMGLVTSSSSPGGYFKCRITAAQTFPSCSCGYKKQNRIMGGVETGENEYTMMAGLVQKNIGKIMCGGVIIDRKYILTAAHCMQGKTVSTYAVVVGEHNVKTQNSPTRKIHNIVDFKIHPQFNSNNNDYDLAILTVSPDITFTDRVGPVCLPFNFISKNFVGNQLTAIGWGLTSFGGQESNYLQKVNLDVVSDQTCYDRGAPVTPRQFCTFTPYKDTCQRDSGGPLLFTNPNNGLLYLIGVTSLGNACGTDPGVNAKVTSMLDWVVNFTPYASYCVK